MKKRNILIVILLIIGILMFGTMEFMIKPKKVANEKKYIEEQKSPLTNDFNNSLEYKTKYVGDNSKVININNNLPLNNIEKTYEIEPEDYRLIIKYKENSTAINEEELKQFLVYNSTANFVLIDNLEEIIFEFQDTSYKLSRNKVAKWYNNDLTSLESVERWKAEVQDKLIDKVYIELFIKENVV